MPCSGTSCAARSSTRIKPSACSRGRTRGSMSIRPCGCRRTIAPSRRASRATAPGGPGHEARERSDAHAAARRSVLAPYTRRRRDRPRFKFLSRTTAIGWGADCQVLARKRRKLPFAIRNPRWRVRWLALLNVLFRWQVLAKPQRASSVRALSPLACYAADSRPFCRPVAPWVLRSEAATVGARNVVGRFPLVCAAL